MLRAFFLLSAFLSALSVSVSVRGAVVVELKILDGITGSGSFLPVPAADVTTLSAIFSYEPDDSSIGSSPYELISLQLFANDIEFFSTTAANPGAIDLLPNEYSIAWEPLQPDSPFSVAIYLYGAGLPTALPVTFPGNSEWQGVSIEIFTADQFVTGSGDFLITSPPDAVATPEPASLVLWCLGGLAATFGGVARRSRLMTGLDRSACRPAARRGVD